MPITWIQVDVNTQLIQVHSDKAYKVSSKMLMANSIIFYPEAILHRQSFLDWSSVGPRWAALVHA